MGDQPNMVDKRLTTHKSGMPKVPWDADALAEKIWALAGISVEDRARALKKAFKSAVDDLDAKKTVVLSYQGQPTAQVDVVDNQAVAKAREQLIALSGIEKAHGKQGGDLVIPLPPWAQVKISPAEPAKSETALTITIPAIDNPPVPETDNPLTKENPS